MKAQLTPPQAAAPSDTGILTDWATGCILRFWGIPFAPARLCRTRAQAREAANRLGYPVVIKVVSPDIPHRTELGAVRLNVNTPAELDQAWRDLHQRVSAGAPAAQVFGLMVQPMLPPGVELIVGGLQDPSFGPVVSVGLGGIFTEVYRDVVWRLAPVFPAEALAMLAELKGYPLLTGARGRPPVDLDATADVIARASEAVAELPGLREHDLNPLLLYPDRVVAVDGLLRLDPETLPSFKAPAE